MTCLLDTIHTLQSKVQSYLISLQPLALFLTLSFLTLLPSSASLTLLPVFLLVFWPFLLSVLQLFFTSIAGVLQGFAPNPLSVDSSLVIDLFPALFFHFLSIILSIPDWSRNWAKKFPTFKEKGIDECWRDFKSTTLGKSLNVRKPCFLIFEMVIRPALLTSQVYYRGQMTWESTLKTEVLYTWKALFCPFKNSGSSFLSRALQY